MMKWLLFTYTMCNLLVVLFLMINIDDHVGYLEDRLSNQCLMNSD